MPLYIYLASMAIGVSIPVVVWSLNGTRNYGAQVRRNLSQGIVRPVTSIVGRRQHHGRFLPQRYVSDIEHRLDREKQIMDCLADGHTKIVGMVPVMYTETDKRMYGAAMLPVHDIDAAIGEAQRAVTELGFKAVFLRPNPPRPGLYWHQSCFDPLWEAVQRLGVPVGFHEGVASHMPTVGADRFGHPEFTLQHACSHSMEQMLALEAMTLGGVLERFPHLKVAFLEGNGSWLPFWLWRRFLRSLP